MARSGRPSSGVLEQLLERHDLTVGLQPLQLRVEDIRRNAKAVDIGHVVDPMIEKHDTARAARDAPDAFFARMPVKPGSTGRARQTPRPSAPRAQAVQERRVGEHVAEWVARDLRRRERRLKQRTRPSRRHAPEVSMLTVFEADAAGGRESGQQHPARLQDPVALGERRASCRR